MGSRLQQVLRSLCLNTGWKYAVFWKLRHRARMMFTWEDAYYDSNQYPDKMWSNETTCGMNEGPYSHDPLGLAVAKMSYQVYSLGEGVVGQVAVSGKHSWIFLDQIVVDASSSSELCGGWQTQFSAGIKTIAVVAVIPHGVVQLGSLHKGQISEQKKQLAVASYNWDLGRRPEIRSTTHAENARTGKSDLCNATLPADGSQTAPSNLPLEMVDSPAFQDKGDIHVLEFPNLQLHQDFENLELPTKADRGDIRILPFSFCAGYELYEALGPSFQKKDDCVWEAGKTGSDMAIEISEGMGSCSLLMENSDMHLLDAVVAKVSHKGGDTESEKSCRDTGESLLTAEKTPCTSIGTISSAGYSFERDTSSSLNSMTRGVESLKGFSSTSSSRGSEHLERPREAVKINKKRARPGESCRPRPRDRQLIQDRIKELRELVPNGSKCSIDSLLERTIKHMLFLQSVTKHAEKLHKCSASKLLDKDTGMRRFSSCEQGSSWAVEVGNNQKVCPIIVENISMNGQMLVEMLCEECSQFLEIAETIRSLGLTILKGVSEAYGNKTWMCFVVEAQNNRSMHRMDVLWSLMQLLQPKTST
ncbi:UNVERIFIED_CONTAM: Transcription factor [Sesamum calycinum]|uniref:Transcription factor n=1 Tax=Sesamum calycinum TaxID=2727403 RepID=A0AAW2RTV7_9LAMI